MATFVLVHGAFRGGWSWDFVRVALESAGHKVYAPDLMGAGGRASERPTATNLDDGADPTEGFVDAAAGVADAPVTLDLWAGEIATLLRTIAPINVPRASGVSGSAGIVLVGHSQGGLVSLAASQLAPEAIERLVLIDSPVPEPGESSLDVIPAEIRAQFTAPPSDAWLPPTPITPGEDISDELADWINERLTPTPAHPGYDPLRLTSPGALALPRHYYFCAKTPPFFPASFTRAQFEERGTPYAVLECGHDAPLTHPELVANLLQSLATHPTTL